MVIAYDSFRGADMVTLRGYGSSIPIATGGTIPTQLNGQPIGMVRCNPAAAVTAVILQPGINNGQKITIVNEAIAANTITFDVAANSFVADGAQAIAGLISREFVWGAAAGRWFRNA